MQLFSRGFLASVLVGAAAWWIAGWLPSALNSIIVALLLGMLIGNSFRLPVALQPGIGFTGGKMLELSILFLATSINYKHIAQLGIASFTMIVVVVLLVLLLTIYLAAAIRYPGSTSWLIGFGTAICGSSAIAALAPGVSKSKEDVGIAMAVINLLGSAGMLILPFVLGGLALDAKAIGFLLGGSLHSVGNVAGAGYSMGNAVGEAAITIKLARVALLSPALLLFNYLVNKKQGAIGKQSFRLPWYLWSFIAITIFCSFVPLPANTIAVLDTIGKFILTVAMAAIGLQVSISRLFSSGRKGMLFGILIFVIQLLLLAAALYLI